MPRTGWTPSIVPNGDDQSVYLVVDDFEPNGRAYRETDVEAADLETVILNLLEGQYKNPVASSPSTSPKAGRRTPPKISPKNCAAAAICNCGTCRPAFWISSRAMPVPIGSSRCGWRNHNQDAGAG
jgi:hypothetical protein